jgi:uncharacterized membrane protein
MNMLLAGRFHPLLLHFPIALILLAGASEIVATWTARPEWRAMAVINIRAGAVFAVATAAAGWLFASAPGVDPSAALEWHRWLGVGATVGAVAAARVRGDRGSKWSRWSFRIALAWAVSVVTVAAHVGAALVWGADFLHR